MKISYNLRWNKETLHDIIKGAFIGLAVAPFAYLFIIGLLLIGG